MFQRGDFWLVDPHTAEIKKMNLVGLLQGEQLVKGRTFDNGCAFETTMKRFLFVRNVFQPQVNAFASVQAELRENEFNKQNYHWNVFSPRLIISEKVQLHIVHPTAGIIQIVENDGKRIFYNQEKGGHVVQSKLPHLKALKFISNLSPNSKSIAFFSAEPLFKENPADNIPQNKKKKT